MDTATRAVSIVTAIDDSLLSQGLNIYPNPTYGKLRIQFDNPNSEIVEVQIYNAFGKRITSLRTRQTSLEVDLSASAKGLYLIQLHHPGMVRFGKILKL